MYTENFGKSPNLTRKDESLYESLKLIENSDKKKEINHKTTLYEVWDRIPDVQRNVTVSDIKKK